MARTPLACCALRSASLDGSPVMLRRISPMGVYGRASGLPSSTSGVGRASRSRRREESFMVGGSGAAFMWWTKKRGLVWHSFGIRCLRSELCVLGWGAATAVTGGKRQGVDDLGGHADERGGDRGAAGA